MPLQLCICRETAGLPSRINGGIGRRLDVLTIALGQASEGKWYASTLELQLASFEVCVACRGVRTLRVTVDENMPISLWRDDHSRSDAPNVPETRQLPALRAAGVAWKLPSCMLVPGLTEAALLRDAEWMQLTGFHGEVLRTGTTALSSVEGLPQLGTGLGRSPRSHFMTMLLLIRVGDNHPTSTVHCMGVASWPPALRKLSIGCIRNESVNWAALPSCLERLVLGGHFNECLKSASWPVSLKGLSLGELFNQQINDILWPAKLMRLALGDAFNQPVADVVWPVFLAQLSFGKQFNQPITDVAWPVSLTHLTFGKRFNQPISRVVWPTYLTKLTFGKHFNKPLAHLIWPPSLTHLIFGQRFDQPISDVVWPASMMELALGDWFNRPIGTSFVRVTSLQRLLFGFVFNQPLTDVVWPASLLQLTFGSCFDQPITDVAWPASLVQLTFGERFNQPITNVVWPASLKRLVFGSRFNKSFADVAWPASLNRLEVWGKLDAQVENFVWPVALRSVAYGTNLDKYVVRNIWPAPLPPRLLAFGDTFVVQAENVEWPPFVESLIFRDRSYHPNTSSRCPTAKDAFDDPRLMGVEVLQRVTTPPRGFWIGYTPTVGVPLFGSISSDRLFSSS